MKYMQFWNGHGMELGASGVIRVMVDDIPIQMAEWELQFTDQARTHWCWMDAEWRGVGSTLKPAKSFKLHQEFCIQFLREELRVSRLVVCYLGELHWAEIRLRKAKHRWEDSVNHSVLHSLQLLWTQLHTQRQIYYFNPSLQTWACHVNTFTTDTCTSFNP